MRLWCVYAQVLLLFAVSFKFVSKSHRMTLSYLVEVYFSIIIVFASIQMASVMENPRSWHLAWIYDPLDGTYYEDASTQALGNHSIVKLAKEDETTVFWMTYAELLYVSTIIMTTAGYGDAYPTSVSSRLFTVLHMLCSVFYVTVIASVGLSKRHKIAEEMHLDSDTRDSFTNRFAVLMAPRPAAITPRMSDIAEGVENKGKTPSRPDARIEEAASRC